MSRRRRHGLPQSAVICLPLRTRSCDPWAELAAPSLGQNCNGSGAEIWAEIACPTCKPNTKIETGSGRGKRDQNRARYSRPGDALADDFHNTFYATLHFQPPWIWEMQDHFEARNPRPELVSKTEPQGLENARTSERVWACSGDGSRPRRGAAEGQDSSCNLCFSVQLCCFLFGGYSSARGGLR